jgi:hypothetical protein
VAVAVAVAARWPRLLAAEQLPLTDEEIARLEEPYAPHPVSGIEL